MEQNNGKKCAIIGQKKLSIAYVDSWNLTISLLTYITSSLGLSREKQMRSGKTAAMQTFSLPINPGYVCMNEQ